jgi:hypothetical protein
MGNNAGYQVSSSVNDGILEIVVTGNAIGIATNEKMLNEFDAILKANNARKAIIDVHALGRRLAETDIYRFVRTFSSVIYDIQSAIVDLPEKASFATAVKNAGLSFEWFTDIDAARKWIKSK